MWSLLLLLFLQTITIIIVANNTNNHCLVRQLHSSANRSQQQRIDLEVMNVFQKNLGELVGVLVMRKSSKEMK